MGLRDVLKRLLGGGGEGGDDEPGELIIEDLVEGSGEEAVKGSTVDVHYTGWLTAERERRRSVSGVGRKFDSSLDRGQPFSFRIGARQVIAG